MCPPPFCPSHDFNFQGFARQKPAICSLESQKNSERARLRWNEQEVQGNGSELLKSRAGPELVQNTHTSPATPETPCAFTLTQSTLGVLPHIVSTTDCIASPTLLGQWS
jgi:hypothetical protein